MWKKKLHNTVTQHISLAALLISCCIGFTGCTKKKNTLSVTQEFDFSKMSFSEIEKTENFLGKIYTKNPNKKDTAIQFAHILQIRGKFDQALAVMRRLAIVYSRDVEVLAAYGKSLAGAGHLNLALDAIRRAQTPEYPNWKLLSAEASILDQLDQKKEAHQIYKKALTLQPDHPTLLSNLGISYLLSGNLKEASMYLHKAYQQKNADSRVKQNLALVLGLQGKFQEAFKIISYEMPPEQAKKNIETLKKMLAQENSWHQIEKKEKEHFQKI